MGEEELSTYDPPVPADLFGKKGKKSAFGNLHPELQPDVEQFSPYSVDPALSDYDPFESIHALTGGNEAPPPPPPPQGNPYVAQILKRMFELRQGMGATGLAAVDIPASLPAQIGGGLTYGVSRAFGANPERAQQLSEYASTPLSYLEPGKLAQTFANNTMGQGTQAYENTFPSQVMGLIDKYGATPAKEMLVSKFGMSPQDADQLVNNAPLIVGGAFKFGKPNIKLKAWGEELRPTPTPIEPSEPSMGIRLEHEPFLDAVKKDLSNGHDPEQLHSQLLNKGLDRQSANEVISEAQRQQSLDQSAGAASTSHETLVKAQLDAMPDTSLAKQNILKEMEPTTDQFGRPVAGKKASDINLDALETQAKFEKFGMNATEGEALNDPQKISDEYNLRAKPENKPLLDRFNERNIKLGNSFDNLREKYTSNAPGGTPVALANDVLETLNNKAKGYEQNISDLYKKAYTAAGEGNNPIDVAGLNENINKALDFEHRTEYLPDQLAKQLKEKLAKGYLTPQEFENFRTDSGQIARTDPDGKVRRAAAIVREQFENAPIKGDFAFVKPMFDEARNAVSEWKTKQENMPFYDAAMADTRTPEDIAKGLPHPGSTAFFDKYVNNKNIPDLNLSRLVDEVGENTPAHEALKAGSLLKLKESAVNPQGVVSQSAIYNNINKNFAGNKLHILNGPELAQDLRDLAFVATRSEHLKGGASYSNASQTQVAGAREQAVQAAQTAAEKIAESAVNLKTGGFGGTAIRGALNYMNKAQIEQAAKEAHLKQLNDALKPHAGVFKE
jgi:hypothetical protein